MDFLSRALRDWRRAIKRTEDELHHKAAIQGNLCSRGQFATHTERCLPITSNDKAPNLEINQDLAIAIHEDNILSSAFSLEDQTLEHFNLSELRRCYSMLLELHPVEIRTIVKKDPLHL